MRSPGQWLVDTYAKHFLRFLVKVPSSHPTRMQLISPLDIPYILTLGIPTWKRYLNLFRCLQENWTVQQWSSLSEIYPRGLMLLYFYMLLMWARLNDCSAQLLGTPDRCIAAELFIRYICEIDAQIDTREGPRKLRENFHFAKHSPRSRQLASEFLSSLNILDCTRENKKEILRLAQEYRHVYLSFSQPVPDMNPQSETMETVMEKKAKVAGGLWATWASILSVSYHLSEDQVRASAEFLYNFGMITQIFDDMADVPHDLDSLQSNLFHHICLNFPEEFTLLSHYVSKNKSHFLNLAWARVKLPKSINYAKNLVHQYLDAIRMIDKNQRISDDVTTCTNLLLKL